jgi:hypothetical protein
MLERRRRLVEDIITTPLLLIAIPIIIIIIIIVTIIIVNLRRLTDMATQGGKVRDGAVPGEERFFFFRLAGRLGRRRGGLELVNVGREPRLPVDGAGGGGVAVAAGPVHGGGVGGFGGFGGSCCLGMEAG